MSLSTKTLVLTDTPAESEGIAALKAGARGYYSRAIDPAQLRKAVEVVQKGEIWLQRRLIPALVAELMSLMERRQREPEASPNARLEGLTVRQRLVADQIGRGGGRELARIAVTGRAGNQSQRERFGTPLGPAFDGLDFFQRA